MGRRRKSNYTLPELVYQDEKSGAYYYKPKTGLSHNLGKVFHVAIQKYSSLVSESSHRHSNATMNVGQLISRYINDKSPTLAKTTHEANKKRIRFIMQSLSHFGIEELTKQDLIEYTNYRFKDAGTSVNRELSLLSSAYREAVIWGFDVENPTVGVPRFSEKKAKDAKKHERYITDLEVSLMHASSPTWLQLYIELKLITGLRQVGLLNLKLCAITDGGLYVREPGKDSRPINFQWTPELEELTQRITSYAKSLNSDYFFPNNKGLKRTDSSIRNAWQKATIKAKQHGLERSISERYLRNKAVTDNKNSLESSLIVGHTNVNTTIAHYEMKGVEVKNFGKSFRDIEQTVSSFKKKRKG